jgi:hypothetical protein
LGSKRCAAPIGPAIEAQPDFTRTDKSGRDYWRLRWEHPKDDRNSNAVIETGFFWEAMHIDTRGSFHRSSLNTPEGIAEIRAFRAPIPAPDLLLSGPYPESKLGQDAAVIDWSGVVLALQKPTDRNVIAGGGTDAYLEFVKRACRKYGSGLLLKVHPLLNEQRLTDIRAWADENGCTVARTNLSCLDRCEFALLWTSTFSVDCFLRGVPVAQVAPSYWHKTGAVHFTNGELPDRVDRSTVDMGYQLADFLTWRYCFAWRMAPERWIAMLRHYARSKEMFPMVDEWCYARNLECRLKELSYVF